MSRPLAFTDHARAWLPARWDAPLESSPARERWNPQGRSREPGTGRQIRPRHRPVSSAPFRGCMIRRKFPALARWAIFCRPWRGSPSGGGARLPVAGLAFRWRGSPSRGGARLPVAGLAFRGGARLPVAGLGFPWQGSPSGGGARLPVAGLAFPLDDRAYAVRLEIRCFLGNRQRRRSNVDALSAPSSAFARATW